MPFNVPRVPDPFLDALASDVARLCNAQEAVLTFGSAVVARFSGVPGARFINAVQPFGVGANAYELKVLDNQARELTPKEEGAFTALVASFQRALADRHPTAISMSPLWVRDHVMVAIDYVTDSFVLLRDDWTFQHVNTEFERISGMARDALVGRNMWETFPHLLGTSFEKETRTAMAGTLPRVYEDFSPWSSRWFQSRAFPCHDGLAILSIDVTDRRLDDLKNADLNQKNLQSQRMESLGTLASGIAHDFNNILGAILGHVGLLHDQVPEGSPGRESVEQIGVAGARARDLVHQILTFARTTTREFVNHKLQPLAAESIALLRSTLPSDLVLAVALTEEPLSTTLNALEVQQIVLNLGTNACHALPTNAGQVSIQLGRASIVVPVKADVGQLLPGLYAELVVSDSGSGMTEETKARLFEPFFTTKRRGQGTGLGLHVVHGIVAAHGGAIVVRSEPGRGSCFSVYLPIGVSQAVPSEPALAETRDIGNGERVAYVDDDEVLLLMVQRVLERAGFQVTVFSDPRQLLKTLDEGPACFDLLVTDYSMPELNGLDVARSIRLKCPKIPIIIATGYVADELRSAVNELGAVEIMNKAHTFEELAIRAARAVRSTAGHNFGS